MTAPADFRLLHHPASVLAHLNACMGKADLGERVISDISGIRTIDLPACLLLIALLMNQRTRWGTELFRTEIPRSRSVLRKLAQTGVLSHVRWVTTTGRAPRFIVKEIAHSEGIADQCGGSEANSELAARVKRFAAKKIGPGRRGTWAWEAGRLIFKVLLEAMNNTTQHAAKEPTTEPWWLSVYSGRTGEVEVAFVDFGVGVIETLRVKRIELLKQAFGGGPTDLDLLRDLITGRLDFLLSSSGTGLPYRGNGLVEMERAVKEGYFRRLTIIANGALVDSTGSIGINLDAGSNFSGTLIHFVVPRPAPEV